MEENEITKVRNMALRRRYGINDEEFQRILAKQGGRCLICGRRQPKSNKKMPRFFVVDHCHETGVVRGILCRACNCGIGYLGDDYQTVKSAAAYLKKNQTK